MGRKQMFVAAGIAIAVGLLLTLASWLVVIAGPVAICETKPANNGSKTTKTAINQDLHGFPLTYHRMPLPAGCGPADSAKMNRLYKTGFEARGFVVDLAVWTGLGLLGGGLVVVHRMKLQAKHVEEAEKPES